MTSLADLPDDVLYHEQFPQMNLDELINFGKTSKKYKELVDTYISKNQDIKSGQVFRGMSNEDIFELGKKHRIIRTEVLKELFRRKHAVDAILTTPYMVPPPQDFDSLREYRKLGSINKYIYSLLPE